MNNAALEQKRRVPVVFDVETQRDDPWLERSRATFIENSDPPGNYQSDEAIDRWTMANAEKRLERAALRPMDGRMVAVAVAALWSDYPAYAVVMRGDERLLIGALLKLIEQEAGPDCVPQLAGFNIVGFDVPFVTVRAAVHSVPLPAWWPSHPRRWGTTLDAFVDVLNEEGKLALWLERFNLPPKLGKGKDVPKMDDEQLFNYVQRDVECERALLRHLAPTARVIADTRPEVHEAVTP